MRTRRDTTLGGATRGLVRRHFLWGLGLALLSAVAAGAEIRVKVRPDGTRFLYNVRTPPAAATARASASRARLLPLIAHYSHRQNLDPRLVQAVVQVESSYNANARSRRGAMGLMQLMPETARELGVRNPYDPNQNLSGGTRYLRKMIHRFNGDLELALAGYNAGPTVVEKYGRVPPYSETIHYVRKVLSLYRSRGGDPGVRARTDESTFLGRRVLIERDPELGILLRTEH